MALTKSLIIPPKNSNILCDTGKKVFKHWVCAKDHFWPAARKFPAQKTVTYCLVSKFITLRSVR